MNIKYHAQFLLDKEKDKPDAKLRYRIKWAGNIVAFNVGYRVEIEKWSLETQRCKNNTTHGKKKISASVINREIGRFEQLGEDVFHNFEIKEHIPSVEEFRKAFKSSTGKQPATIGDATLFDRLNEFVSEMGSANQWTKATYQKFAALKNHLTRFNPELSFSRFDEKGLTDCVNYMRDELDMRNSTIGKQIGFLKWFLRWATAKGYNSERAFQTFSPKLKTVEKKVIFLEWDELMRVHQYEVPENGKVVKLKDIHGTAYEKIVHDAGALKKTRDLFCFCCFTSLRYSDVANLKHSDLFEDYISITTIKTADSLKIELNDYAKEILSRYTETSFPGGTVLPVISNQRMNDYLKELGELCGINKPITVTYYKGNQRIDEIFPKYALLGTHTGRRTFICNALMLGIAPQIVMKWTGHSDYKSMKPYIDVADSAKADAMRLFNKKSPDQKNGD